MAMISSYEPQRVVILYPGSRRNWPTFPLSLLCSVLKVVQDRAAGGTTRGLANGDEFDMVAWAFDPACVLQSDIVGFTALGSRISPQALCG